MFELTCKKLKKYFVIPIMLMPAVVYGEDSCSDTYKRIMNKTKSHTHGEMIALYKAEKSKCSGDGVYEYLLGKLYIRNNEFAKAEKLFNEGIFFSTDENNLIELKLGLIEIYIEKKQYEIALENIIPLINKYPRSYRVYYKGGVIYSMMDDHKRSILFLEKSNELKELAITNAYLSIGYYNLFRYKEAVSSMEKAIEMDPLVIGDTVTMMSLILSLIELGEYEKSKIMLHKLEEANPEVVKDRNYKKIHKYFSNKEKELTVN